MTFRDRSDAGRRLITGLARFRNQSGVVVLALPPGGVPVAYQIARALEAPLDLFIVRRLGYPGAAALTIGAVASGGVRVDDPALAGRISPAALDEATFQELLELDRQQLSLRGDRPALDVRARSVILVDDGLTHSATVRAAIAAVSKQWPARLVVALPAPAALVPDRPRLQLQVDEVVTASRSRQGDAFGPCYQEQSLPSDDQIRWLLEDARRWGQERGLTCLTQ